MTKRILFVGGEQPLWQQFQAYSAADGNGWGAEFAHSAGEARAWLERSQFTAVVSDVQLFDSNGLDLLDEVLSCQPEAYRIVLSDFQDTRNTIQCVGRGHHHLSIPCDVTTLLSALDQASALRVWLPGQNVRNLISQMRRVPSPPVIYFQVAQEIQSQDVSVDKVGEIISQDPAIAAKVLQLANSAVFGLQLQVFQPSEAVAYIGLDVTKSIVLLAHTFTAFDQLQLPGFSIDSLWCHSVIGGRFAREVAVSATGNPDLAGQAFTAGLLHDIGKLLFAANMAEEFGQALALARERDCALWEAEAAVCGCSHAELGGCLLGIWGLPKPIVEAVAVHHDPLRLMSKDFTPVTATHVADVLAHEAWPENLLSAPSKVDLVYLKQLGLDGQLGQWRKACLALQPVAG